MNLTSNYALRIILFSTFPALVIFGLGRLAWTTIYLTAPVFFPFSPYLASLEKQERIVFPAERFGLWLFAVYSLFVALLVVWLAQGKAWRSAWLTYAAVIVSGALLVHMAFQVLGFEYFLETP